MTESETERPMRETQALSALLAKLEAATGPSRELDAAIALAVGWRERDGMLGWEWVAPEGRMRGLPHFTKSLDAAMTLVPPDWYAIISSRGRADLRHPDEPYRRETSDGATAILALCRAAVRARLAGQKEHP